MVIKVSRVTAELLLSFIKNNFKFYVQVFLFFDFGDDLKLLGVWPKQQVNIQPFLDVFINQTFSC